MLVTTKSGIVNSRSCRKQNNCLKWRNSDYFPFYRLSFVILFTGYSKLILVISANMSKTLHDFSLYRIMTEDIIIIITRCILPLLARGAVDISPLTSTESNHLMNKHDDERSWQCPCQTETDRRHPKSSTALVYISGRKPLDQDSNLGPLAP